MIWYFGLYAVDKYVEEHGEDPGSDSISEIAIKWIVECASKRMTEYGLDGSLFNDSHGKELIRYANCKLHNIGATMGGVISQEAIKIITHQFVPMNNTFMLNGITCTGMSFEF